MSASSPENDPSPEASSSEGSVKGRLGAVAGTKIVLAVDAMGGDRGPATVVAGLSRSAQKNPHVDFLLFGDAEKLIPLVEKKRHLKGRVDVRDAQGVVSMGEKPAQAMRRADTSMRAAVDSVKSGEAQAIVSCGNTGALMAISMIRLRKLEGVNRPAIACLWPSRNKIGFNVMLDVGADIRADQQDLLQYAMMGASYARNGIGIERPRIGLLNVGTEEHKGRAELKVAHDLIKKSTDIGGFEYVGFVEGSDIPSDRVDVIVTDGFTGNVALKTGEGTARLISDLMKESFKATPLSRIAALLALTSLKRLQKRIDPRRVNGGVFLGLRGIVVKSHGSADETGISAAVKLAYELAASGFSERLAARVASAARSAQSDTTSNK